MATAKRKRPSVVQKPTEEAKATKTATKATKAETKAAPATKTKRKKPITVKPRPSAKEQAAAKTAARKASAAKKAKASTPASAVVDENGFIPGTDSALIAKAMVKGASSRVEVNELAEKAIENKNGLLTRSGKPKNVPSLGSALLARLLERGYTVESHWALVPPAGNKAGSGDADASGNDASA